MRFIKLLSLLGTFLFLSSCFEMVEVRRPSPLPPPQEVRGLPQGSYQQTCQDCHLQGNSLRCKCQTEDGNWQKSSISLRDCRDSISNQNAVLTCEYGRRPSYDPNNPIMRHCTESNVFGRYPRGGGCNTFGCYPPGGGCNAHGCYAQGGGCNPFGCYPEGGNCNPFGCTYEGSCKPSGCPDPIGDNHKKMNFRCE